jgi:hypothetical protein
LPSQNTVKFGEFGRMRGEELFVGFFRDLTAAFETRLDLEEF